MSNGTWTQCFLAYREYQLYFGGHAPCTYGEFLDWWRKNVAIHC